jgi:serine/threonine protein kinase
MLQKEPLRQANKQVLETSSLKRVRNRVILPDGTQNEPLGSGIITGVLGVGGMANVYEIWNSKLELNRAVKLLHPNCTEETIQRFDTEIKITAKLHHPNIIEIHAVGCWNDLPYIEMERIDGKTIEALISERGAFPPEVCTAIGVMIGRALRYAHNQEYVIYGKTYFGVIHRDLKPSNIMISNRGIVKLMDFGIARPTDTSIHTTDGSILGTMQYLSPEQLEGKEPDVRTDIFSLGAVFYEMITGQKAFPERNAAQLMLSRLKNDFKPLSCYDLKIPARLRNLIHKCMAKDRDKRIQDATSFLSEITLIHKNLTSLSPEQVLKQFIGSKSASKVVLSTRSRIPAAVLTSIITVGFVISGAFLLGPKIRAHYLPHTTVPVINTPVIEIAPAHLADTIKPIPIMEENTQKSTTPEKNVKGEKKNEVMVSAKTAKPTDFTEQLCNLYGTTDLLTIFVEEVKNRHFESALKIIDKMNPQEASSSKAIIYRIRALKALQRRTELRELLLDQELDDAEFYLEKARYFLENKNTIRALDYLQYTSKRPAAFIENDLIRLERLYLTARLKSMEFDAKPSVEFKNQALESWYELKAELQTSKDHPYFREADLQMQRITEKINSSKG